MQKEKIRNSILLLLTAVIWGTAFVAQSVGMDYIGPFTFNAARFLIGGTVLIPLIVYRSKKNPLLKNQTLEEKRKNQKTAWMEAFAVVSLFAVRVCFSKWEFSIPL